MRAEDVKYLIVHCSDSPQGRGDGAKEIHQWHKEKGWAGIGYHFVITEGGEIQHGRPTFWAGAHAYGYNKKSLGICLIGKGEYTEEQYNTLRGLLKTLKRQFPNSSLAGHRDLDDKKDCPLFDVRSWFKGE